MKKTASTTTILAFIMVVNALSYATIIPLLYPLAAKFGITPFGQSLLFTSYSLAQFLATPLLGRLSDRFGRKPIMTLCLVGTALSLGMMAMAQTAMMLFIARIIDGVTGGNISIAQAIISDSSKGEERTKAFGMIGAAFGFGFLVGPVVGGVLANYGMGMPFWFSAALAILAAVLTMVILPETLSKSNQKEQKHEPLFNFGALFTALLKPYVGVLLLITFIASTGMNAMILGFQAYTNDVLKLTPTQIGLFFTAFGLIGVLMQVFAIGPVLKRFESKKRILIFSLGASAISMVLSYMANSPLLFFLAMCSFGVVGAFRDPMASGLLSERTKSEDQGAIMGINQSYMSLGQIAGPLAAGAVMSGYTIQSVFLLSGGFMALAAIAGNWLYSKHKPVDL